jgi:hypothetical protein
VDYKGFNEAITVTLTRATTDLENWIHQRVTKSKHHAYTTNTTLTQELQGLKYSKESRKPEEQYKQDAYMN